VKVLCYIRYSFVSIFQDPIQVHKRQTTSSPNFFLKETKHIHKLEKSKGICKIIYDEYLSTENKAKHKDDSLVEMRCILIEIFGKGSYFFLSKRVCVI
jgi:hypothetical protein